MKKILFLLLAAATMAVSSNKAEAQTSLLSQYSLALDTLNNATSLTKDLTIPVALNGYYKVVTVQLTIAKISGTVGGTATLQGSLDGVNWYSIGSAYTITDASQVTRFQVIDFGEKYLRVHGVGTGTMSAQIQASLIARKP